MPRSDNLYQLPAQLPEPIDDGACAHLIGMSVPTLPLWATSGEQVNLATLPQRTVVYAYPRTGQPEVDPPPGWNEIPGARGCTPQACAFRDHHRELQALGAQVFGLSTQDSAYQREAATRLHLPFALLSDAQLAWTRALRLPTFEVAGLTLLKRLTLILRAGTIEHVFYPVFPPDKSAETVITWLTQNPLISSPEVS